MKQEKSDKQHPHGGEGLNRSAKKSKHNTNILRETSDLSSR